MEYKKRYFVVHIEDLKTGENGYCLKSITAKSYSLEETPERATKYITKETIKRYFNIDTKDKIITIQEIEETRIMNVVNAEEYRENVYGNI